MLEEGEELGDGGVGGRVLKRKNGIGYKEDNVIREMVN